MQKHQIFLKLQRSSIMRHLSIISLFFVFSLCLNAEETMNNSSFERGYPIKDQSFIGAYNASSKIEVKNAWGFSIDTSFIYWQIFTRDLYFATRNDATNRHNNLNSAYYPKKQMADFKYNYKPGFKVGIGMNTNNDDWYTHILYTWLYSDTSKRAINPVDQRILITLYEDNDPENDDSRSLDKAVSHWKNKMNVFDWILARSFYIGKHLSIDLSTGPKGFLIHSKDKIYTYPTQDPPTDAIVRKFYNNNRSWGIGAELGMNLNFLLGYGVRFFGSTSCSLAYERSKLSYYAYDTILTTHSNWKLFNYKDKRNAFITTTDVTLGFGYGTHFYQQKCYFDVSLAYEFQLWTNQISHLSYANIQSNYVNGAYINGHPYNPSNLMLHGLTFTTRFDF
jgi:hypothetical protein